MTVGQVGNTEKRVLQLNLLHIKNKSEVLPGWTLTFYEVLNNVYKVKLIDHFGRQAKTTDTGLENAITTTETFEDFAKVISKTQ